MVEVQVLAAWLTPTSLFVLLNIVLATIFLNHHAKHNKNDNHHRHGDSAAALSSTASQPHSHPQLLRAPSLFSRVASFNFSHYYHSDDSHVAPHPDTAVSSLAAAAVSRAPSLISRVASFKFSHYYHSDDSHAAPHPDTAVSSAAETVVSHPPAVQTIAREPSLLYRVASLKFGWTPPPSQEEVVHSEGKKVNKHEEEEVARERNVREEKVEVVKVKKAVRKKKAKKEVVADVAKVEMKTTVFRREDEEVDTKADDFINKFKQQLKLQRIESLLRYRNDNATSTA